MGTTNRAASWKYEDCKPILARAPVTNVNIARGDICGQASGTITGATSGASITAGTPYPASEQPWNTDLATTQADFNAKFLGVAQSQVNANNPLPRLNTAGVHEFDCAAATFNVGDLVGPAKQSGNLLEDQKVAGCVSGKEIGRVAVAYLSNTTKVLVRVTSKIMP